MNTRHINSRNINLKDFKLNEEGGFSITRPYESGQIIFLIENFIKFCSKKLSKKTSIVDMTLTDATACMGGDLVRFSGYFKIITGVEIDTNNFNLLIQNCKKFDCKNVILFNQDYLEIYDKLKQDVIYLDPPWGGTDYKNKDIISLKIGDLELWELIKLIKHKKLTNFIFIKAPMNVCLNNIEYDSIHVIFNKSKTASFKLICMSLVT
jgi:hypothetical protein